MPWSQAERRLCGITVTGARCCNCLFRLPSAIVFIKDCIAAIKHASHLLCMCHLLWRMMHCEQRSLPLWGSVEMLGGKHRRVVASKWRRVFELLVYLVYLTLMSDGREVQGEWGVYRMAWAAVDREARSSCHHSNTCIAHTGVSLFTAYLCNPHFAEQRITVFSLRWTLTFEIWGETWNVHQSFSVQ